jgi:hypothetical protein
LIEEKDKRVREKQMDVDDGSRNNNQESQIVNEDLSPEN